MRTLVAPAGAGGALSMGVTGAGAFGAWPSAAGSGTSLITRGGSTALLSISRLMGRPRPAWSNRSVSSRPWASKDNRTPTTKRLWGHCQVVWVWPQRKGLVDGGVRLTSSDFIFVAMLTAMQIFSPSTIRPKRCGLASVRRKYGTEQKSRAMFCRAWNLQVRTA